MGQTLTTSDDLYARLEKEARLRGFSIERLIEEWGRNEASLRQRKRVVHEIDSLSEHLFSKYGDMPDRAGLIREDRMR